MPDIESEAAGRAMDLARDFLERSREYERLSEKTHNETVEKMYAVRAICHEQAAERFRDLSQYIDGEIEEPTVDMQHGRALRAEVEDDA